MISVVTNDCLCLSVDRPAPPRSVKSVGATVCPKVPIAYWPDSCLTDAEKVHVAEVAFATGPILAICISMKYALRARSVTMLDGSSVARGISYEASVVDKKHPVLHHSCR